MVSEPPDLHLFTTLFSSGISSASFTLFDVSPNDSIAFFLISMAFSLSSSFFFFCSPPGNKKKIF